MAFTNNKTPGANPSNPQTGGSASAEEKYTKRLVDDIKPTKPQTNKSPEVENEKYEDSTEMDDFVDDEINTFGQPVPYVPQQEAVQNTRGKQELENLQDQTLNQNPKQNNQTQAGSPADVANQTPAPNPQPQSSVKEQPPGGPARRPKKDEGKKDSAIKKAAGAKNTASNLKNYTSMAKDAALAASGNVLAAAKLAVSLFKNPKTRGIIIGAITLSLILTALAIIIPLSMLGSMKGNASVLGKTITRPADPVQDQDLVKNVLKLSGDQLVVGQGIDDILDKAKLDLLSMRKTSSDSDPSPANPTVKQIDSTIGNLDILKGNKTPENSKTFLADLEKTLDLYEDDIPVYTSGKTQLPVKSDTDLTFNNDLHGGSRQHADQTDNHSVYAADNGICDAVDVSANLGDSIVPIFAGALQSVESDENGAYLVKIKNGDYTALYAHILNPPDNSKIGSTINLTDAIGTAATNHIQIEIIYKNYCVVTTSADVIDHNMSSRRHEAWGGYMWDHIVKIFNLSQS